MIESEVDAAFRRLAAAFAGNQSLPAGGAAAVVSITMGVGLGLKVIDISNAGDHLDQARRQLDDLLQGLLPAFGADCAVFGELLEALRLPRGDAQRGLRVRDAWREATAAPVAVTLLARDAESRLRACREHIKASVRADLDAALDLVRAGQRIAERNARENASRLDAPAARELLARLDGSARD